MDITLTTSTTNYLKVTKSVGHRTVESKLFFFDDHDADETRRVFEQATAYTDARKGSKLSLFKRPSFGGPWDYVKVIGENFGFGQAPIED
jgi:hypothetical protein